MIKNIFKAVLISLLFILPSNAADRLYVEALEDFNTENPNKTFAVLLVEDSALNGVSMIKGDKINCVTEKIVDPKRAKRNAKLYLKLDNWEDNLGEHKFEDVLLAKYAKDVINIDTVKKIPTKDTARKAAGFAGNFFFKGFSYGLSFVDGFSENKDDNRLKSGVKQVYEDSFLSYIEKGTELEIKKGDLFYLIINKKSFNND